MIKFKRLLKSFRYAFKGLFKVLREEQNLKVQFIAAFFVIIMATYFRVKTMEWAILLVVIAQVVMMEIINSAVERVSDVIKPRISNYVKEIKDIMAAAVMFASIIAVVVGVIIFYPYVRGLANL